MSSSDNTSLLTTLQNTINEFPNTFSNTADKLFNENHTNDNHSHLNNIYIKKENSSKHTHPQYTNPNLSNYLTISKFDQDSQDLTALIQTNTTNIDSILEKLENIGNRLGTSKQDFPLYRGKNIYGNGYNIKI